MTANKNIDSLCGIVIEAKGNDAEILIYDQIGMDSRTGEGLTAKAFAEKLSSMGKLKNINVRINSSGGSVFDGTAIYNTLKNNPAKVTTIIDGAALSVASIIAMAGDEIRMAKNGYLMIHDPHAIAVGGADDMRKMAEMLDVVKSSLVTTYSERSKQPADKIAKMMTAETWMTASEAKDLGFVDSVTESLAVAASFDAANFANAPEGFMSLVNSKPIPKQETKEMSDELKPQPATIAEIKANCEGASSEFILAQVEAGATLAQALTAHTKSIVAKLKSEAEAHAKQIADAKAAHDLEIEAIKAAAAKPGVKPVASGATVEGEDSDPITAFETKLKEAKATMPADKAAAFVARKNPELRAAYIEAINAKRR